MNNGISFCNCRACQTLADLAVLAALAGDPDAALALTANITIIVADEGGNGHVMSVGDYRAMQAEVTAAAEVYSDSWSTEDKAWFKAPLTGSVN